MIVKALRWQGDADGHLELVDQCLLPGKFERLRCEDVESLYQAIRRLAVRGAPAIGVAAGFGMALAMQNLDKADSPGQGVEALCRAGQYLKSSRPTAVNLAWAVDRVAAKAQRFTADNPQAAIEQLKQVVFAEASQICTEDERMCLAIGRNGREFILDGMGVLTHCNAGALATAGQGTALSVMFEAHKQGKRFRVFADETRPLLQGARLTAWELQQAGIDVTILCDNMAGWLMKQGKVDIVITGADRIAANGDAANKIGTYSLSVLARRHGAAFYIAAPSSTFDLSIKSGDEIPIEQRDGDELRYFNGRQTAPENVSAYNPAFDVTPAENITAVITEHGIIEKPDTARIAAHLAR